MTRSLLFSILVFALLGLSACQFHNGLEVSPQYKNTKNSAILGGRAALEDEFPFVVNIWLNTPKDHYVAHICGGSLIHPRWVLTAAHCVLEEASESDLRLIKPADFNLYMGSPHISGKNGRSLRVRSIVIHPKFSWPRHDVALMELTESVHDIPPVSLHREDFDGAPTSTLMTVVGWGLVDSEGKVDGESLQKLSLPLIPRDQCNHDVIVRKREWSLGPETLCVQTTNNQKASCHGDSGGPLLHFDGSQYHQIGIVSWGSACGGARSQNSSNVEGHAAVSDAYDWIQSILR